MHRPRLLLIWTESSIYEVDQQATQVWRTMWLYSPIDRVGIGWKPFKSFCAKDAHLKGRGHRTSGWRRAGSVRRSIQYKLRSGHLDSRSQMVTLKDQAGLQDLRSQLVTSNRGTDHLGLGRQSSTSGMGDPFRRGWRP